jgi:hypothetical protein
MKAYLHLYSNLSMGILPGTSKDEANPYIDIAIVTGMGEVRSKKGVIVINII